MVSSGFVVALWRPSLARALRFPCLGGGCPRHSGRLPGVAAPPYFALVLLGLLPRARVELHPPLLGAVACRCSGGVAQARPARGQRRRCRAARAPPLASHC
eukprot:13147746-Alexandrium_andersonii.AAC.1